MNPIQFMSITPILITGGVQADPRGSVSFVNDFDLEPVRRVYFIMNDKSAPLRAWQAHKIERKWFICAVGSFKISLVKIDDWNNPSKKLPVENYLLQANMPSVLFVPGGYANAICSLEDGSLLQVYSDTLIEQAQNDQFKFSKDYWPVNSINFKYL